MIKVENLTKEYVTSDVKTKALQNVDLSFDKGEIIVLLGTSGSGKSTLLNIMSGLDKPTSGKVFIDEVEITSLSEKEKTKFRRDHVGFIFQEYHLLPSLTVEENIMIGSQICDNPYDMNDILNAVGLTNHRTKYPHQLSGGEQQRVSIARAIIKKPSILFCDEPTGALDEDTSDEILDLIKKVNIEYNTTIILITHNPDIATIANKVVTLNSGKVVKNKVNKG